jgi:hypothetical protein
MYKALDQSLIKKNVKVGFKVTKIWPFNPKAMNEKKNQHLHNNEFKYEEGEDHYTSKDEASHNQQEEKEYIVIKLLNITRIVEESTINYC